ncbi:20S-pre-rRNA D-site endonuclease nob1 [Coemansia sp. RSA 1813]|nr:20S-pre-rRNA D-site endonuclease nob1 [Coemansia sp. RSA 1646]KAJ1771431.1 20S-pre-rRNA D-site endonuclease nob1 [Coemansia sp. RSA 1843]KAJ2089194.1 20S-pre-rRNA D-site endonuclease nob1 [Coemansia sp. RSA 986]KAJ2213750.1 20S-pre-rRNA D-site endonuclease nob1 [Coemansia sp. RSA 487]KAJ2569242.1 20S-pre-rRNA D-site endonuclease nob1 [Coemansia sp. RSA 1813]
MSVAATENSSTTNPETMEKVSKPQSVYETQTTEVGHEQATDTDNARKRNNDKPVVTLVIDTNPLIKGLSLDTIASKFVTIPEVYKELRSKAAKERYAQLDYQYGIDVMEPDAESISAVYAFAKRTGDFSTLALADLKVIALAFMLEKQANGMTNLKLAPGGNHPDVSDRKILDSARLAVGSRGKGTTGKEDEKKEAAAAAAAVELEKQMDRVLLGGSEQQEASEPAEILEIGSRENDEASSAVVQSVARDEFEVNSDEEPDSGGSDEPNTVQHDESSSTNDNSNNDDDGWQVAGRKPRKKQYIKRVDDFFNGSWITPTNVKKYQTANAMGMRQTQEKSDPAKVLDVACVTSDFAMQNVILGMGIHLVTPDGVSVNGLRTWVLRCHACFHLTSNMSKQFCPSCGHATLKRCSVSTGADGRLNVHLKSNYKYNLRGTIYSLPQAHGGPHKRTDIITRPDDKAYLRAMQYKKAREAKTGGGIGGSGSLMDPDFIPDLLLGSNSGNPKGHGVATDARGMPMVGRNSKNPNVVRRTGNRKKKNSKI